MMSKKLLVKFGDKVACALILAWVTFQVIGALGAWKGESEIETQIQRDLEVAKKAAPAPEIEPLALTYVKDYESSTAWPFSFDSSVPSVHYRRDKVDVNVLQEKYESLLADHGEHLLHEVESGGKACVFPGCPYLEKAPDVFLGVPEELKLDEATVMTVKISWLGVKALRDAELKYCVVQKRKKGKDDVFSPWAEVLHEDGAVLKVYGRTGGSQEDAESQDNPAIPAGFQLPGMNNVALERVEEEVIAVGPKSFSFLDFNLDPSTEYQYRVKGMGVSLRDGTVVEGLDWTKPVTATTGEDQGLRFTRFVPGLRAKDGQLQKKSDGSIVSPDKVYVTISKLFTPPWSPVRYFISYEHRNIIPGDPSSWAVGKLERRFSVSTENGEPVYIDSKKENFLYPTKEKDLAAVKLEMESSSTKWLSYKVQMDFSTEWLAKEVVEEIEEEVVVTTKYNAKGKEESVEEPIKKYRYFLVVENKDTKAVVRLELERDDLETRLLRY